MSKKRAGKDFVRLGGDQLGGEEYEGQLRSNVPHGFGRAKFKSGSEYRGTWIDGQVTYESANTCAQRRRCPLCCLHAAAAPGTSCPRALHLTAIGASVRLVSLRAVPRRRHFAEARRGIVGHQCLLGRV